MTSANFQPGFRFSLPDALVLCAGLGGFLTNWIDAPETGWMIGFVILHFFLFCNVFRIPRRPELIWAGVFVILAGGTIMFHIPGWTITFLGSLVLSTILIWRSTRRPDYHGICWRRWNPDLETWWQSRNSPEDRTRQEPTI